MHKIQKNSKFRKKSVKILHIYDARCYNGSTKQIAKTLTIKKRLEEGEHMQITDVRIRKVTKESKMKAVVSITLDNEFVVHDIKVIEGEKGLFIAMPSRKAADGEYRDIAHPINSETRDRIQRMILERYEVALLEVDDTEAEVE